jgi:hypothetical protein
VAADVELDAIQRGRPGIRFAGCNEANASESRKVHAVGELLQTVARTVGAMRWMPGEPFLPEARGHMHVARRSRTKPPENQGPLTPEEAGCLHRQMTKWYYECGNGMLLPHDTREMYLKAKERMGFYAIEGGKPDSQKAGQQVMRELSLLRSQMKSDLDIYGVFYFDSLVPEDKEFIRASGPVSTPSAEAAVGISGRRTLATGPSGSTTGLAVKPGPSASWSGDRGTGREWPARHGRASAFCSEACRVAKGDRSGKPRLMGDRNRTHVATRETRSCGSQQATIPVYPTLCS